MWWYSTARFPSLLPASRRVSPGTREAVCGVGVELTPTRTPSRRRLRIPSLARLDDPPPETRPPAGQVEDLRAQGAALLHHGKQGLPSDLPPVVRHPFVGVAVAAGHLALLVGGDP